KDGQGKNERNRQKQTILTHSTLLENRSCANYNRSYIAQRGHMISTLISLLYFLLIGILAGFFASAIMKAGRGSALRYLVIGAIGALLGGFLFRLVGLAAYGLLGELIMATVGAVILLFLLRKVR